MSEGFGECSEVKAGHVRAADAIGRHKQQKKWKDFKRSRTKDFHIERYSGD